MVVFKWVIERAWWLGLQQILRETPEFSVKKIFFKGEVSDSTQYSPMLAGILFLPAVTNDALWVRARTVSLFLRFMVSVIFFELKMEMFKNWNVGQCYLLTHFLWCLHGCISGHLSFRLFQDSMWTLSSHLQDGHNLVFKPFPLRLSLI